MDLVALAVILLIGFAMAHPPAPEPINQLAPGEEKSDEA